jgi:N-acetylglutamate synthase
MPAAVIRPLTLADHDEVYRLWTQCEGICVSDDDARDRIELYLERNPGLCWVATVEVPLSGKTVAAIVGTVLCGHDGRRGILRHLAVAPAFRRGGLGRSLVEKCLAALAAQGIRKCNIYVQDDNLAGRKFWEHLGYRALTDDYRTLQIAIGK